ncbi:hypothetical protein NC651_017009 [Populus alba x Populus x berolinensis]|nr:hypothetical protein NC651_017009 [Populus alba x Populus x berolinensis]
MEAHTLSQGTLKDNRNTPGSSSRIRDDPEAVQARKKVYVKCAQRVWYGRGCGHLVSAEMAWNMVRFS